MEGSRKVRWSWFSANPERARPSPPGTPFHQIEKEILSEAPVDLSDPIVKISSHALAYRNLHVIMSQLEQPGLSSYRTPSILYLTSETSLLNTFPEVRTAFLVQFPGRVDYSPTFCEGMLVWLMGLNIWADNK